MLWCWLSAHLDGGVWVFFFALFFVICIFPALLLAEVALHVRLWWITGAPTARAIGQSIYRLRGWLGGRWGVGWSLGVEKWEGDGWRRGRGREGNTRQSILTLAATSITQPGVNTSHLCVTFRDSAASAASCWSSLLPPLPPAWIFSSGTKTSSPCIALRLTVLICAIVTKTKETRRPMTATFLEGIRWKMETEVHSSVLIFRTRWEKTECPVHY